MNPLRTSRDPPKRSHDRPRRLHAPSEDLQRPSQAAQETPGDRSGPFWTIVDCSKGPLRSHRSAKRGARTKRPLRVCAILGIGKRANRLIGVAKIREFRVLGTPWTLWGPHEPSQGLQRSSKDLSRLSQETSCTLSRPPKTLSQDLQRPSQALQETILEASGMFLTS